MTTTSTRRPVPTAAVAAAATSGAAAAGEPGGSGDAFAGPSLGTGRSGAFIVVVLAVVGFGALGVLLHTGIPAIGDRATILVGLSLVLAAAALPSVRVSVFVAVFGVMFTALIRRVYPTPHPVTDFAAVMPFVLMGPLVVRAIWRRTVPWPVAVALALFALNTVRDPTSGAPALLSIAAPTLAGLYIRTDPVASRAFVRSWLWLIPFALGYGLYQRYRTPVWDAQWIINAQFPYAGTPGDPGFRAFGPFPAPAIAAFAAALTLLIIIATTQTVRVPSWLTAVAFTLALVSVALSGVRSSWLFGAVAILVAILSNSRPAARWIFLPTTIVGVLAVMLTPALSSVFLERADTLSNLSSDRSFQSRSTILSHTGQLFSVFGGGLGSGTNAEGTVNASSDNGYLIVLGEGGLVGALALLLLLYGVLRHLDRDRWAFAVFWLLGGTVGYYFTNSVAFVVIAMCTTGGAAVARSRGRGDAPPAAVAPAREAPASPSTGAGGRRRAPGQAVRRRVGASG